MKKERHKEYTKALEIIEAGLENRICYALDNSKNPTKIGCPITNILKWPELNLFFPSDTSAYLCDEKEISREDLIEIRKTILTLCIEMTR